MSKIKILLFPHSRISTRINVSKVSNYVENASKYSRQKWQKLGTLEGRHNYIYNIIFFYAKYPFTLFFMWKCGNVEIYLSFCFLFYYPLKNIIY